MSKMKVNRIENTSTTAGGIDINTSGNVGIGTTSPARQFTVYNSSAPIIQLVNSTTGQTVNDGVMLYESGSDFVIENQEAGEIKIYNNGSQRAVIDSSGNVGIGTSSPSSNLDVEAATGDATLRIHAAENNSGSEPTLILESSNDFAESAIDFKDSSGVGGAIRYNHGDNALRFLGKGNNSEAMRIDSSGNVLIGTTVAQDGFGNNNDGITLTKTGTTVFSNSSSGYGFAFNKTAPQSGSTYYQINFRSANTSVGGIFTNASSTTYGTTSDYRLKENVTTDWNATTRLKQLNPVRFNFIADADTTVDGFIAHEVQAVVPEAITGMKDEVDDDGNAVMQSIDQSKLVPLLTAALKEAIAKIETLEQRLTDAGL